MIRNVRRIYSEFPGQFWLLAGASFIDLVGVYLIFPFFSLYFTEKFGVSLIQVGYVFATWALAGVVGQAMGGALTDKLGRKIMVIVGLVFSALTSLALIYVQDYAYVYVVSAIGGLFANSADPARTAMVADLLPEKQLSEGYSIFAVVDNAALSLGPALGGLLASASFALLFFIDVVTSGIAAIIIAIFLMETRKQAVAQENSDQSIGQIFRGYSQALNDKLLLIVLFLIGFIVLAAEQWYFSVPIFMRDTHQMPAYYYGSMMGVASLLAVIMQYPITRKLRRFSYLTIMAFGSLVYALGFGLFIFVSGYVMFLVAFIVIGVGQMLFFPTIEAFVGKLAPAEMRGRYMGVLGIAWSLQVMAAPLIGGYLMDTFAPSVIWYVLVVGLITVAGAKFVLQARLPEDSPIASQ